MAKLRPWLGPACLLASLLGPRPAHADAPTATPELAPIRPLAPTPQLAPPPPISPPRVRWYGWETLLTGTAMFALPLALLKKDPVLGLCLGSVLSPLTTMSMHMIHGDEVKAYVSLPLSYAMMIGGGALAAKLECSPGSKQGCVANAAVAGVILGGASAVVLDAAALAWGGPALPDPVKKKAVLRPSVVPLPGGAAVGIGGTF